jgi:NADPH2:quinone reductase
VGSYSIAEARAAWEQILPTLQRVRAKPIVDQIFPFNKLHEAFARLAEGPMGKVVLRINA